MSRQRIARKIKYLLVLAERGATVGERRAAQLAAEELARRHQILVNAEEAMSDAGFEKLEMRLLWSGPKTYETYIRDVLWRDYLLSNAAKIFGCTYMTFGRPIRQDLGLSNNAYHLYAIGLPEVVADFAAQADFLFLTIEDKLIQYYSHVSQWTGHFLDPAEIMSAGTGIAHFAIEELMRAHDKSRDDLEIDDEVIGGTREVEVQTALAITLTPVFEQAQRGEPFVLVEDEDVPDVDMDRFKRGLAVCPGTRASSG